MSGDRGEVGVRGLDISLIPRSCLISFDELFCPLKYLNQLVAPSLDQLVHVLYVGCDEDHGGVRVVENGVGLCLHPGTRVYNPKV